MGLAREDTGCSLWRFAGSHPAPACLFSCRPSARLFPREPGMLVCCRCLSVPGLACPGSHLVLKPGAWDLLGLLCAHKLPPAGGGRAADVGAHLAAPSAPGRVLCTGRREGVGWTSDGEAALGGLLGWGWLWGPAGHTVKRSINESLNQKGTFSPVAPPNSSPEEIAECRRLSGHRLTLWVL